MILKCLFVSDLHGAEEKYHLLYSIIEKERPDGVLFGGDLLPKGFGAVKNSGKFLEDVFFGGIERTKKITGDDTRFFVIMGNDDPRSHEGRFLDADKDGLIEYIHNRTVPFGSLLVKGYTYVSPTPFLLKDWERYDVSRFVDPGCVSPEEGFRTVDIPEDEVRYSTISEDLKELAGSDPPEKTIFLFHSPPYGSDLDRIAGGRMLDHAPLDEHVGSIAIQRHIKDKQPLLTLHGHIHESPRLTGNWMERTGETYSLSAAHDGPELSLVRFDTDHLSTSSRDLISI